MFRFLSALLCLVAAGNLGAQALDTTTSGEMKLNPGDQIRVTVWRKAELSGDFPIAADGRVAHPLYREVQVTGVPLSTVEERLRVFLTRYETNPQVVVIPLLRVIVSGEVRQPNILAVPPGSTVAQAVVLGGGATERGRLDRIELVRDGRRIPIDLTRSDSDHGQIQVRSGDQIMVGRRGLSVREYISPLASSIAAIAAVASIFSR
jgi:protein involved in polysaccharide export with SLBB domain